METSKRKVVYVITLPDLGGAQSHVYEVMKNIRDYGTKPVLVTGKAGWLTEQAAELGIKTYVLTNMVREISPLKDFRAIGELCRILKMESPDIVHCHSSKAGIVGRIAAKICGIKSIFTAHGWAFTEGVPTKKRWLYQMIENMAGYITDKIICVSEYDRQLGQRRLPAHKNKMVTIHNCIPDLPESVRDWQRNPLGEIIHAVVVARFSAQKRNVELLYVLRNLIDDGVKITLTFIGDGPNLLKAKRVARELQLLDKVEFLGARENVAELLPQYDLFILFSNWEGFPISIIEAMRAGLPVIASNVGGCNEAVIDGETGCLLSNKEELEKIKWLIGENREKIKVQGEKGRMVYQDRFIVEYMVKGILEEYKFV